MSFWALMVSPLLIATIVALIPGERPKRKILFILFSGIIVYGLGTITDVIQLPVKLAVTHLIPQWEHDGKLALARIIRNIAEALSWLPAVSGGLAAFLVPIFLRRGLWARFLQALPDQSLQPTAKRDD